MKIFISGFVLGLLAFAIQAQVNGPSSPQPVDAPFSESLQAVVVITKDWEAVQGVARLYERKTPHSRWKAVGAEFPIVVGRKGLAIGADSPSDLWQKDLTSLRPLIKHEGDGRAPAGLFPLTYAFGSKSVPTVKLPYTALRETTECVDDENSTHYNTVVNREQVTGVDWKSSEKMLAVGQQYERGVFVGYNSYPPKAGSGSCIFLHIWKDSTSGTSGCTAMEQANLERVLAFLDPAKRPYLVQLPAVEYVRNTKTWKLPNFKIPYPVYP